MLIALCNGQSQDAIVIADGFSRLVPSPVKEPAVGWILQLSVEPSRQLEQEREFRQDEPEHPLTSELCMPQWYALQ